LAAVALATVGVVLSLIGPPSFGNPSYDAAMTRLKAIPEYRRRFAKAFPNEANPITPDHWGQAIGAYERTLVTPSPFDAYLAGNEAALTAQAKAGLREFIQVGCVSCHNGVGVGGGMYQKFGLVEEYWKATGSTTIDKGRVEVTQDPADTYVFKGPEPAQRGHDAALFPRRFRFHASGSRADHGAGPARADPHR